MNEISRLFFLIIIAIIVGFVDVRIFAGENDERLDREKINIENKLKWFDEYLANKEKETKEIKYGKLVEVLKKVNSEVKSSKEYWGRRLALIKEGNLGVSQELKEEEQTVTEAFWDSDRCFGYTKDAFWNSSVHIGGWCKEHADNDDTDQDIGLKLGELEAAYSDVEQFFLDLAETGTHKDSDIQKCEAELILIREKKWIAIDMAIEKAEIIKDHRNRQAVNDQVESTKETLFKSIEEHSSLREQIAEFEYKQKISVIEFENKRKLSQENKDEAKRLYYDTCHAAANEAAKQDLN